MTPDLYLAARPLIQPVDVIAFWGPRRNPISGLIELVTDGGPSHVAVVRDGCHAGSDVTIVESTIEGRRNGVQTNPLGGTLIGYPAGSRAKLYRLLPSVRTRVDLMGFYACCGANDGIVHYDIGALFRFLLPDWITQMIWDPKVLRAEVCSVWVATALEAAHATCGVDPRRQKPSDVIAMPIFQPPVRIL